MRIMIRIKERINEIKEIRIFNKHDPFPLFQVVVEDNESVEGMSYDWTSKTLYFVDGAKPAIEMVQVGHREVFYYKLCAASIINN